MEPFVQAGTQGGRPGRPPARRGPDPADDADARHPDDTGAPMTASPPADVAKRLLRRLDARRDEIVDYVRELAEIESPSREPEAQQAVFDRLVSRLEPLGYRTRRIPGRTSGGHLFARPPDRGCPFQLLLGHVDTVWPRGTLAGMPVRREGEDLHGPGVFDMKTGLAQMVFALEALDELGAIPALTPVLLVTSDEEVGSPESERWVRRLARRAERAFVLEPALGPEGRLKTARKGTGTFHVVVRGRSAHAGLDPEDGASAILELSHVIQRLHGLSDAATGLTVNVGEIRGGSRPNVIAAEARASVDVRVPDEAAARRVERAIRSMEPVTAGTRLEIEGGVSRPPMEPTPGSRDLWSRALELSRQLGFPLEQGRAGGASDANFTSQYTPTLDGLGAVGGGAHADHEHARIPEMPRRAALLALLLLEDA